VPCTPGRRRAPGTPPAAFVLDAVLRGRDGDAGRGDGGELRQGGGGVLRLHGEHDDVAGGQSGRARPVGDRDAHGDALLGGFEAQAVVAYGLEVRAAGDQRDVVAVLEETRADHAADRAGPVDDDPHRPVTRTPACVL
jgi:hypothetical protein